MQKLPTRSPDPVRVIIIGVLDLDIRRGVEVGIKKKKVSPAGYL